MAVHVEHRQTMLILQHEKNFMDDYIRHFAQSDTGNGTIQYSFLRFRLLSGGKCAGASPRTRKQLQTIRVPGKVYRKTPANPGLAAMCKGRWWLSVT